MADNTMDFAQPDPNAPPAPEPVPQTPFVPQGAEQPAPQAAPVPVSANDVLATGAEAEQKAKQNAAIGVHEAQSAQQDFIAGQEKLADAANREAYQQQIAMQHQADQLQVQDNMQHLFLKEYQARSAKFNTESEALLQQIDAHVAASHPRDIWQAAGVNPILGGIAVALSGMGGGPNQAFEMIKARAGVRAQQIAQEGQALGMKASTLAQMYNQSAEIFQNSESGVKAMQATLLEQTATQVKLSASKYAGPNASANAQVLIGKFLMEAAQLKQQARQLGMQGIKDNLSAQTNVYDLHQRAVNQVAMKKAADQIEGRKVLEGRQATDQAIRLIQAYKETPAMNVTRRNQILAELGPILAKADVPGSNRILTESGRKAELQKMGGMDLGRLGRIFTNPDELINTLVQQQQEREGGGAAGPATPQQILQGAQ